MVSGVSIMDEPVSVVADVVVMSWRLVALDVDELLGDSHRAEDDSIVLGAPAKM